MRIEQKIDRLFEMLLKRLPDEIVAVRKEGDAITFGFPDSAIDYQGQKTKEQRDKFKKTFGKSEFELITAENTSIEAWNGVQQNCFKHNAPGAEDVYCMRGGRGTPQIPLSVLEKIWRLHSFIQCLAPYSDREEVLPEGVVNFFSVPKARNPKYNNVVWQIGKYYYTRDAYGIGLSDSPVRITDSQEVAMIWIEYWKKKLGKPRKKK